MHCAPLPISPYPGHCLKEKENIFLKSPLHWQQEYAMLGFRELYLGMNALTYEYTRMVKITNYMVREGRQPCKYHAKKLALIYRMLAI